MNDENLIEAAEAAHDGRPAVPDEGAFDENEQAHGAWTHYFTSGVVKAAGEYEHGKKVGRWNAWNPDGSRKSSGVYVDDRMTGEWTFYWPSGEVHSTGDMVDGRRHGQLCQYNEDGTKVTQGSYVDDLEHGEWTYWNADGTLWGTALYKHGEMVARTPIDEDD